MKVKSDPITVDNPIPIEIGDVTKEDNNSRSQDIEINRIDDNNINDNNIRNYLYYSPNDNGHKYLLMFLTIIGYYLPHQDDSKTKMILARVYQGILLICGCVGLIWHAFIFGLSHIAPIKHLKNGDPLSSNIFFNVVLLFFTFFVPILQVTSLIYGVHVYVKRKLDQSFDDSIKDLLLKRAKYTAVFFISMSMIVIIIQPCGFSKRIYNADFANYDDNELNEIGVQTFSLYVLHEFFVMIYNFSVTCFLSTLMLFTSLTLHEIKLRQDSILKSTKNNSITYSSYMEQKNMITKLNGDSFYTVQIITVTAGLNAIMFILMMWYWNYYYEVTDDSFKYKDMIFFDFKLAPFLLKEIVFFYHILLTVASINSNQDDISKAVCQKYLELNGSKNDTTLCLDYILIHLDCFQNPTILTLLSMTVRKNTVLLTLAAVVINFAIALIDFSKNVK